MRNSTAFILNFAPHYRGLIFNKISKELKVDFYFGNIPNSSIKKIDYSTLNGFQKEFKTTVFLGFYWYTNMLKLIFTKNYKRFVLTGDVHILSNWVFILLCRLKGRKVYLWSHGWYGDEKGLRSIIKFSFLRSTDGLFVYGNYARNLLLNKGFSSKKVVTVFNSLNYYEQLEIREKLSCNDIYSNFFDNRYPVLVYIGRVQKSKKIELLFEAMRILIKEGLFINLMVIGGVDSDYNLENYLDNDLKKNVFFYGACYDEKKNAELLFNANLCVSPGNVGLTAIHSLMYGTPVVTNDSFCDQGPEFEVIEEGVTGLFFKNNDFLSLARTIKKALSMEFKKSNCYNVIDSYWTPDKQIERFLKLLKE
ncbi:glycosyltransferase family 4 protein [Myroides odoratimimus]|uniref:glycosyltransferase family 4 protein n=1 Tax=Myroides odoratimimus TaxID=76832 RepID=UPI001CE1CAE5|nr:glycosyltransferase family 4 protein [Myroides odoratimimus]MCA4793874.1 glycosyltransferase family 4 protein [Myroides odoratimimus]MCA4821134.1 glycosyltransferase family 4 protein [Myroides odoratimimus]